MNDRLDRATAVDELRKAVADLDAAVAYEHPWWGGPDWELIDIRISGVDRCLKAVLDD
jgi:hypothetical protein